MKLPVACWLAVVLAACADPTTVAVDLGRDARSGAAKKDGRPELGIQGTLRAEVKPTSELRPSMEVELTREGSGGALAGRVVLDGAPVAHARLLLHAKTLTEVVGGPLADENDAYWNSREDEPEHPFLWAHERVRDLEAASNGAFRFDDLESDDYRLEALTDSGARRALEPVRVMAGSTAELGDVELLRGAALHGRVLVPPGGRPGGIEIHCFVLDHWGTTQTDPAGRFELDRLPAGRLRIAFWPRPGTIVVGPCAQFELSPGESREVEVDLQDRAGCFVSLTIDGGPDQIYGARLRSIADQRRFVDVDGDEAKGSGRLWTQALGPVNGVLRSKSGLPLAIVPRVADLVPGAEVDIHFTCRIGSIESSWPEPPPEERFSFAILSAKPEGIEEEFGTWYQTEESSSSTSEAARSDLPSPGRPIRRLAAGAYAWSVEVVSEDPAGAKVSRRYRRQISVAPGSVVACNFGEQDRIVAK